MAKRSTSVSVLCHELLPIEIDSQWRCSSITFACEHVQGRSTSQAQSSPLVVAHICSIEASEIEQMIKRKNRLSFVVVHTRATEQDEEDMCTSTVNIDY
jgi:hypothetical protein